MKKLTLFLAGTLLASSLTACGRSNTLPPVNYYPNRLLEAQQNAQIQDPNAPNLVGNNNALPSDVTQGQVGSIVGYVVNRSGRPLHNVEVSLASDPSVTTRSKRGDFVLMNVPAGQHTVILKLGNVETQINVNVIPNGASAPEQNPVMLDGEVGSPALAFANPNRMIGAFKVDQGFLHQWQPRSVVVSGGTIYVSAIDVSNILRMGTVIKMSSETGEEWKDIGKEWLGLKHPLNSTARGIAMNMSGSLLVVDEKKDIFTVDPAGGGVEKAEAPSALDIAAGGGKVYVTSTRGLEQADDSGQGLSPVAGVEATGGLDVDNEGNAYVPVQNTIQKVAADGTVTALVKNYLNQPADVAVDPRNGDLYILDAGEIKRYDKNGEFIVNFNTGAVDPVALDIDETGSLYIADFGRDHRSAQILKFEAVPLMPESSAGSDAAMGDESFAAEDEFAVEDEFAADESLEELPDFGDELPTL